MLSCTASSYRGGWILEVDAHRHHNLTTDWLLTTVRGMPEAVALPHPIPTELADLIAERFRLLSEPMRVRLLDSLRDGEASVGELAARLDTTQQNVSKHLKLLIDAGVVGRERRGTSSVCSIIDPLVFEMCEAVCGALRMRLEHVASLLDGGEAR